MTVRSPDSDTSRSACGRQGPLAEAAVPEADAGPSRRGIECLASSRTSRLVHITFLHIFVVHAKACVRVRQDALAFLFASADECVACAWYRTCGAKGPIDCCGVPT